MAWSLACRVLTLQVGLGSYSTGQPPAHLDPKTRLKDNYSMITTRHKLRIPEHLDPKPVGDSSMAGIRRSLPVSEHTCPDPREDLESRSLKGLPIQYPLVVRVPN